MARIVVEQQTFVRGEFPPVCCKTGEHADHFTRWEFKRRVVGVLPITKRADGRVRFTRRAVWIVGAAVVVCLAVAAFASAAFLVAGVALAVAWAMLVVLSLVWAPNAVVVNDNAIDIRNVHPAFVSAVLASRTPAPVSQAPAEPPEAQPTIEFPPAPEPTPPPETPG